MDTVNKELRQYQSTALDLSKIDNDFEEFEVGNRHDVVNKLLGIDEELRIIKRVLSLDEPHKPVLTFGDKFETLTGFTAKQSKQTAQMIKQSSQEIRNSMQSTVDYITGGNGGYVVQKFNEVGQPIATWYTDNLDTSQANEMLIINNRGILGSTDGGKTYNTAIDIRGNINASMINAGILQGIKIICNDATITGGSINIETSGEEQSIITLVRKVVDTNGNETGEVLTTKISPLRIDMSKTGGALGNITTVIGAGSISVSNSLGRAVLNPSGVVTTVN